MSPKSRFPNRTKGRIVDTATVESSSADGKIVPLWNNEAPATFPAQQRKVEDLFTQQQVLHIFHGECNENYAIDHPEPKFCFALEKPKGMMTTRSKGDHGVVEFYQPDADPTRVAEPSEIVVGNNTDTYYTRLTQFDARYAHWERAKEKHDEVVRRANTIYNQVFGQAAQYVALDTRRSRGLAAAWELIKQRFTPRDKHLTVQLVKTDWEGLRKFPQVSMVDFFAEYHQLRHRMEDAGRPPDNLEMYDRLKVALLFDDYKYEKYWSATIDKVCADYPVSDPSFIVALEAALIAKDTEKSLDAKVQATQGTYSAYRKEIKDTKAGKKEDKLPEVAMQAEGTGKKAKDNAQGKTEGKADAKASQKPAPSNQKPAAPSSGETPSQPKDPPKVKMCYTCGKWGHIARQCPEKPPDEGANMCEEDEEYDSDGVVVNHAHIAEEESTCVAVASAVPKYLDSACSSTMSPRTDELTEFTPKTETILLGGKGHSIISEGRGNMGVLRDVMVSDELRQTLVSIPKFDREGRYTVFGGGRAYVVDEPPILRGDAVMTATLQKNNMYLVDAVVQSVDESLAVAGEARTKELDADKGSKPFTTADRRLVRGSFGLLRSGSTTTLNAKQILHRRLGHIHEAAIEELLKKNAVVGAGTTYAAVKNMSLGLCDACLRGKMHARSVPSSLSRDRAALKPMEEIAMDPVPMVKRSLQGNTYANLGIDLHSSYAFMVPARTKAEQSDVIDKIKYQIADKYGHKIKLLHTDGDSVYLDKEFVEHCKSLDIRQEQSTPYIHQENGSVERLVGTAGDGTRVSLIDAQASEGYWEYAMGMFLYAYNRTLHGPNETKTPYEKLTGKTPDISILRPFGAHCWVQVSDEERFGEGARWQSRAQPGVIVGYSETVPGAYLVLISTNPPVVRVRRNVVVAECPTESIIWNLGKPLANDKKIVGTKDASDAEDSASSDGEAPDIEDTPTEIRRSNRAHVPNRFYANAAREVVISDVPQTLAEAMAGPEREFWRAAVDKEMDNYKSRGGLSSIARDKIPKGATVLDMKKVFKRSKLSDSQYKYKFRLAVRGFRQREGIDYTDTYSPTVMEKTVKIVLHIAAHHGWVSHHVDVGCAYMEAPPDRVMYIRVGKDLQVHGFSESEYAVLGTNAYGTKQAGRVWYLFMASVLIAFNMERSVSDVCLFFKWNEERTLILIVLVYVDDFGITGNWLEEMERFIEAMRAQYSEIKITTPITKYVGLELTWDKNDKSVLVSQEQYCRETVDELLKQPDATATRSPLPYTVDYREPVPYDQEPIWDVVGKLRFLADRTRPDIAVATGTLGSYQAHPGRKHVNGAQHVLRYCKGTFNTKIKLGGKEPIVLQGAVDASYDTKYQCKPTLGYVLYLGKNTGAVIFKSKRATTMANSVGEAETRAASEATREVVWARGLLEELGEKQTQATILHSDSQAMMDICKDWANNPRIGCFNRDVQWLRQAQEQGIVKFKKVPGADNEADLLTKLLPAVTTERHSATIRGVK